MNKNYKIEVKNSNHLNSKKLCCPLVYKRQCDDNDMKFLNTPLELTLPNIFNKLDKEQILLINSGAKGLVLVENASDIISKMKDMDGFIENIIKHIIEENQENFMFLGSHTISAVIKEKWLNKYPDTDCDMKYGKNKMSREYDDIIKSIKPTEIPEKAIIHIAVFLKGNIGHYGIIIKNNNKVIVFDSMQKNGKSEYSAFFCQFAEDIFNIEPSILMDPSNETCPQPTGGFVNEIDGETKESYLYRIQEVNSQDHFCYFWSIWYFHIFIKYGEVGIQHIFNFLHEKSIPPLVVIKRYIWSILHYIYSTDEDLKKIFRETIENYGTTIDEKSLDLLIKFFLINFRYIWVDIKPGHFHLYSIIECYVDYFRKYEDINLCLTRSVRNVVYMLEDV